MTRSTLVRFLLPGFAAVALLAGSTTAALAGTQPTSPSYGQPDHHPQRHCEFVWLSGVGADLDGQGQDVGYGQQGYAPSEQPQGEHHKRVEKVEAFQLVKVCERGEHLTITDVTGPFVEETEPPMAPQNPYAEPSPTPSVYTTAPASTGPSY